MVNCSISFVFSFLLNWFEYQLLMNLQEPSTIIMDNASYHSTVVNKVPTAAKNADIPNWLTQHGIPFETTSIKTQLINLVQMNKPEQVYEADLLAEKYGHKVLQLPPYHCLFNPIEHIWGITKNYYRDNVGINGTSAEKALAIWKEALKKATPDVWFKTVQHAEKIIQGWWNREVVFDREDVPPLIINLGNEDDYDSDDFLVE